MGVKPMINRTHSCKKNGGLVPVDFMLLGALHHCMQFLY